MMKLRYIDSLLFLNYKRYATICQSARIVPIVEPEVLSDGTHSIERCQEVHEQLLTTLFNVLVEHHVYLEGMILKPAMILAGTATPDANKDPEVLIESFLFT